jgi:hypothetical protein
MATFTSAAYDGRYMQLSISESVDAVSNTSTLYWTLSSIGGTSTYYTIDATTVTINGTNVYYKARTAWDDRVFPAAKGSVSGSISVPHNSDGTKTITVVFSTRVYIYGSVDYGGSMTLTNIDRTAPTVSCSVSGITANAFKITASSSATADIWQYSTNGGSVWVQFSSTAGTSASITLSSLSPNTTYSVRVRARKKSNQVHGTSGTVSVKTLGGAVINSCSAVTADAATVTLAMNVTVYNAAYYNYITIKNGSTEILTFAGRLWSVGTATQKIVLNAEQRTTLLAAMSDTKSFTATIALATKSGSEQIGNTSTCSCIIQTTEANSAPTMTSFSVRDSRTTTVAVTGNSQLFIQDYSYVYVTPGTATAKNGATIVKYAATCNGVTYSNTTGDALNLYAVNKSGTLDVVVTATDSRGYTVSTTKQITVIPYEKPKISEISLRRTNDIEAEMQLVFNGSISPITVDGTQKNSLMYVQYRYKLTSASTYGSYTDITEAVTQNGSSFSYSNLELCSLDANSSYNFHIYIRDRLNTLSSVNLYFTVPQGTPLVALRKKKVGINTPTPEAALHVVGDTRIEGTLKPDKIDYTFEKPYFGTCETEAATAAKVVACDGFVLKTGAMIAVQFSYTNTATSPSMNVNSTGAKAICGIHGTYVATGMWVGKQVVLFVYNGTWWIALSCLNANTARYGITKLLSSVTSTSTTLAATPYAVKQAYDRNSWTSISLTNALALAYGGTGAATAADARTNLGITCTSLFNGTLTTGSTSFNYGSYKAYIIIGQPSTSGSRVGIVVPASIITTSSVGYQFADESYYYSFNLYYSGTTCYLAFRGRNSSGQILRVFGVN